MPKALLRLLAIPLWIVLLLQAFPISRVEAQPNPHDPGDPKKPLPAGQAGTASNLDGLTFPHYGVAEKRICELPEAFIDGTDAYRRSWARGFLADALGEDSLPEEFTCHELVTTNGDGEKVLRMYKVDLFDHSSSGRPLLYHPRHPVHRKTDPDTRRYVGGIWQLRQLPDRCFGPRKPPQQQSFMVGQGEVEATFTCTTCMCADCGGCPDPGEEPNCFDADNECHPICEADDANWCE